MSFRVHDPRLLRAACYCVVATSLVGWLWLMTGCAQPAPRPPTPFWTRNVGYGSMGEKFPVGRTDLVLGYDYDRLAVGLIAGAWVFIPKQGQVVQVHRLVRREGDDWITKGDANAREDPKPMTRRTFAGVIVQPHLNPLALR